jgi:DNA invertase Pin-like site-specific DNA recombinase
VDPPGAQLIVSPYDVEARWSDKRSTTWIGYKVHLTETADELRRTQVHLQVLDQHIHTNDATGRLLFHMLGAIAQFETELRAERQIDGLKTCQSAWGTVWSP